MTSTNNILPPTIKTNFKNKVLNPLEEPCLRKNIARKYIKTNRDLYETSGSQERHQQEPKSSIELKISSKSILPTLRQEKSAVYKRYREKQGEVTLDKLLGSHFKQIDLNQIEDFSKELFPPRPVSHLPKIRHDSFNSHDSEKENIRIENNMQYSYNYESNCPENEPHSGSYSDDLQYRRLQTKPGKLYFDTNRLGKESPLEGTSPKNQGYSQSSTLPTTYHNEYRGYNNDSKSPVLKEIYAQPLKKSQFGRKAEEIEGISPMNSERNDQRQVTPAVMIMENNENFYANFDKSPERIERKIDRNNSQKLVGQIEVKDHYKSQMKSDKSSPALGYKGIKPLNIVKPLKENKAPPGSSVNESGLINEDQALLQKYGSKFGIKPQELPKKRNRSPLQTLQLSANTLSGRNLRNSTPFMDDKKQAQSSTLQQKYKPLYQ